MSDILWMQEALQEAQKAFEQGEVPVGAVIVCDGRVVARGYNQVERCADATAHAERLVISQASHQLNRWRLTGCTLYCTLEPCAMCAGAILSARLDRLVWGARDLRLGANGSWIDLFKEKHPMHTLAITSGVCDEESAWMMKEFFRQKREENRSLCKS